MCVCVELFLLVAQKIPSVKFKCSFSLVIYIIPIVRHKRAALHVLELIHATFRVALSDLAQRLVFVASLAHILPMDLIVGGFFRVVTRNSQILLQCLQTNRYKLHD